MRHHELVHFRLIEMPCCGAQLCCVNPRFYNYCPECGKHIFPAIKGGVVISDTKAELSYVDDSDNNRNIDTP